MPFDPSEIPHPPAVHAYELPGGWHVWAGRTAQDNERLSLKVARNDDWWFHLRGMPGSHVVLVVPFVALLGQVGLSLAYSAAYFVAAVVAVVVLNRHVRSTLTLRGLAVFAKGLLVAFLVPLLFGYMFGDVGHGAVIMLLGFVLRQVVDHPGRGDVVVL